LQAWVASSFPRRHGRNDTRGSHAKLLGFHIFFSGKHKRTLHMATLVEAAGLIEGEHVRGLSKSRATLGVQHSRRCSAAVGNLHHDVHGDSANGMLPAAISAAVAETTGNSIPASLVLVGNGAKHG